MSTPNRTPSRTPNRTLTRALAVSLAALALTAAAAPAMAQGRHGGHGGGHAWHGHNHWAPGLFWGGLGVGVGLGLGSYYYYAPGYPGYVLVERPPAVYYDAPAAPREPAMAPAPEPIIYPRDHQSPAQTEADRQDCNRWATTQPKAMADSSVFHRATLACMEGRGYTVR